MKPYEVRVLLIVIINEANGVTTFIRRFPKFDHAKYV